MKRFALFLTLSLALSFHSFSQTVKLPLWAAFPEGDTYVGFSFPGGGIRQAELAALTNYYILNGKLRSSIARTAINGDGSMTAEILLNDAAISLNYELVNFAELPNGETVALVRIGKGERMSKCLVRFMANMQNQTTGKTTTYKQDAALVARFQTGNKNEIAQYSLSNNDFKFEYNCSDGKSFKYEPKANEKKLRFSNSFPDKDLDSKMSLYWLDNTLELSFRTCGLWSKGMIDQLMLGSASFIEKSMTDKFHLQEVDPELGSYCSLCSNRTTISSHSSSSNYMDMNSIMVGGSTGNRISALVVKDEYSHILIEHSEYNRERVIAESRQQYEDFIKTKIEDPLKEWQQKGEFEKSSDWANRVNSASVKHFADSLLTDANATFIKSFSPQICPELKQYDADNEVFLCIDKTFGEIPIKVPIDKAQSFKHNWSKIKMTPSWSVTPNGRFVLETADFVVSSTEKYSYDRKETITYNESSQEQRSLDLKSLLNYSSSQKGKFIKTSSTYNSFKSDVDISIPTRASNNKNVFAVVICNENYQSEKAVEFAVNDGSVFAEYCKKALGIPETNVHLVKDATLNNILREVSWLTNVAKTFNGDASLILYYAGHGVPDVSTKEAFLLPIDGYGSDTETGFSLSRLYKMLSDAPSKSTLVLLDACFSGCDRSGEVMASNRGVAINSHSDKPTGNLIVFSATAGDQVANPFGEKSHGLYTYYLLEYIKSHPQSISLGELTDYVSEKVARQSIVSTNKPQTPTVSTSLSDWRSLKF